MKKLGVIGGSGLYEMDGLKDVGDIVVSTPFGSPSHSITRGYLGDVEVSFLPRHGLGHRLLPTELPYRANIHALKQLGVDCIMAISAVGSMKEEIVPGHLVVIDQFIDRTRHRPETFFGDGIAAHVHFADPVCLDFAKIVFDAALAQGASVHEGGTYLCMEGPQFSTRAESRLYRSWGVSVIGMTNIQEARLAREAGICYSTLALATDYDCWHESEADVEIEAVLQVIRDNSALAKRVISSVAEALPRDCSCRCANALDFGVVTSLEQMSMEARERLKLILPERFRP